MFKMIQLDVFLLKIYWCKMLRRLRLVLQWLELRPSLVRPVSRYSFEFITDISNSAVISSSEVSASATAAPVSAAASSSPSNAATGQFSFLLQS